jgi:hypothetical protein
MSLANDCDLSALRAGDALVVMDQQDRPIHRKVTSVARVWLTVEHGDKFRIATGEGEERLQFGHGYYALTVPVWETREETKRLKSRLADCGWVPRPSLTLTQMRRAAALLSEFEAERSGGLL